jgi:DNA repair protein RadC
MDNFIRRLAAVTKYAGDTDGAIARRLAYRFGSLDMLARANVNTLMSVDGVDRSLAVYIRLLFAGAKRATTEFYKPGKRYSIDDTYRYLISLFFDCTLETAYAVIYDERGRYMCTELLSEGRVSESEILPGKVLDKVLLRGGASAIVAHNHPLGFPTTSDADITATNKIKRALELHNKRLIAHYIVSGTEIVETSPTE